ncbi:MAG: hypothetical protein AAGD38_20240, partial [Acidobacteriota bacterium]
MATQAAAVEVRGQVYWLDENDSRHFAAGAEVRVEETRATTVADDTGFFIVHLPEVFRPGQEITLFVATEERVIFRPFGGKILIPSDPTRQIIDIELVVKGSRRFLSDEGLEQLVLDLADEMARQRAETRDPNETSGPDFTRALRDWAVRYGFGLEEVRAEVDRWSQDVLQNSED